MGQSFDAHNGVMWANGSARLSQIRRPSVLIIMAEWWYPYNSVGRGLSYNSCIVLSHMGYQRMLHGDGYHDGWGSGNYLFCDGHVKFVVRPSVNIGWGKPGKYEVYP